MLTIKSSAALERALDTPLHPTLKRLLTLRRDQLAEFGDDLLNFVVIEPRDTIASITTALGVSPLAGIIDGATSGTPDFVPAFEWVADHGGWLEVPFIFSDDGTGVVLIVQDDDGVDADLLALLRAYAVPSQARQAVLP